MKFEEFLIAEQFYVDCLSIDKEEILNEGLIDTIKQKLDYLKNTFTVLTSNNVYNMDPRKLQDIKKHYEKTIISKIDKLDLRFKKNFIALLKKITGLNLNKGVSLNKISKLDLLKQIKSLIILNITITFFVIGIKQIASNVLLSYFGLIGDIIDLIMNCKDVEELTNNTNVANLKLKTLLNRI